MNGPMAMTGQELIILRKNLGLSQTGLAARLDLSRSSIWRYEVENQKIPEVVSLAMMALSIISKAPIPRPKLLPAAPHP